MLLAFVHPIRDAIEELVLFSVVSYGMDGASNFVQPVNIIILYKALSVRKIVRSIIKLRVSDNLPTPLSFSGVSISHKNIGEKGGDRGSYHYRGGKFVYKCRLEKLTV